MWAVSNQTRFKADRTFARDADGAEVWIVAVRATFTIKSSGEVEPAEEQQDVRLAPEYFGEPAKSSLRYDTDLVRTRPGTDVLLHAQAYAPGGKAARDVEVEARVGPVDKRLRIVGDRKWKASPFGSVSGRPALFVQMPIRYERAWGGPRKSKDDRYPANPIGVGAAGVAGLPLPNCEYPDEPNSRPHRERRPAGFGPIPCDWQPRVGLAGTYDEAWQKERQPLVPKDFREAYFHCAPEDQQVRGFLRGGEEVVLRNLTPEGSLRFFLPRVVLGFQTRIDGGTILHQGKLYTVILEPDERRLVMVWQTALPCHHTLYTLKETVVFEKRQLLPGSAAEETAALET